MDNPGKWWGWGKIDQVFSLEERPGFWPYLQQELELPEVWQGLPPVPLSQIELPPVRIPLGVRDAVVRVVGETGVTSEKLERVVHTLGKSYRDLVRSRQRPWPYPPDLVVYPRDSIEVANILEIAVEQRISVVPWGGGTSVVGGVDPLRGVDHVGVISLDLGRMNHLLKLDEISRTATFQAGILGPAIEAILNERGYTLGHFPQSFEHSTLGGWIATRSAGQLSNRLGKIEAMVLGLMLVTPSGLLKVRTRPASATGPDLRGMVVGSEGTLGVIVEATVRLQPLPKHRDYRGILFTDFRAGTEALRRISQGNFPPAVMRLSDEKETVAGIQLSHPPASWLESLKRRVGRWYLERKGYGAPPRGCLLILGIEGDRKQVKLERREALRICGKFGGAHLGRGPGQSWYRERFELPYLRDALLDRGILVEPLETAATWEDLLSLYEGVKKALEEAILETGARGLVLAHISHTYPMGASLYFTFMARQIPGCELEQWRVIKTAATEAILEKGGTLSHHHGVGVDHAPWLEREIGAGGIRLLKALKDSLDPAGIMNPGKLISRSR